MRICRDCLYADNGNTRLCLRKNGMRECFTKHPHPYWRERLADKLSPSLRRIVEQSRTQKGEPHE